MTEDEKKELESLKKENIKLSNTNRLLRKKLTRLRKREEALASQEEEDDVHEEIEHKVSLIKNDRCPKCNGKIIYTDMGIGQLAMCDSKGCDYRKVIKNGV